MDARPLNPAVETLGLTKDYGGGHGLFDLNLRVQQGEVFGLIGANGAGKSTVIRLLMDLVRADGGTATILGLDSRRDSLAIKRAVGYLPGELPQWPGLKAAQIVGLLAGLRGGVDSERIMQLSERLHLDLSRRYSELNHGNKQKVGLITVFMHSPELLILDEPTLGLDPLMQREVRNLIAESVARGATCLLSSHVLAEIELVCDRIGFIRDGRLLKFGSLTELRQVRIHQVCARLPEAPHASALAEAGALPGVESLVLTGGLLTCSAHGAMTELIEWLARQRAVEIDSRELSLEEVFLADYATAS